VDFAAMLRAMGTVTTAQATAPVGVSQPAAVPGSAFCNRAAAPAIALSYPRAQAFYTSAVEFVAAIAEPVSRPRHIHEYVVTDVSLHSAVALGLSGAVIVKKLDLLCKTALPAALVRFIGSSTRHAGKLRLVLFGSSYCLETFHREILEEAVRNATVRAMTDGDVRTRAPAAAGAAAATLRTNGAETGYLESIAAGLASDHAPAWQKEFDRDDVQTAPSHYVQLLPGKERDIVRACRELGYPLVEVRCCAAALVSHRPLISSAAHPL
jgi:DNA excision repair protein ERCC-3